MMVNKPKTQPDQTIESQNPMIMDSHDYVSVTNEGVKKKSFRETYYENEYKKLKDKVFDSI